MSETTHYNRLFKIRWADIHPVPRNLGQIRPFVEPILSKILWDTHRKAIASSSGPEKWFHSALYLQGQEGRAAPSPAGTPRRHPGEAPSARG